MNGVCVATTDRTFCGIGGAVCVTCGAGEDCVGGHCVASSSCAATCAGCCRGEQCIGSPDATACGANGAVCQTCASGACVDGVCTSGVTCDENTCKAGCCDGTKCIGVTTKAQCGIGGSPCQPCGSGYTCSSGACTKDAPACSSYCLTGCCDGTKCIAPPTDAKCGFKGAECKACPPLTYCTPLGVCLPKPCNASTCATGCCAGVCVTPSNEQHCGLGGATCVACSAGNVCSGGTCVGVRWRVILESAVLDSSKTWDALINTAPDPQVHLAMGTKAPEAVSAFSSWIDNTYTPSWNETMFERAESFITGNAVTLTVLDRDDVTLHEQIGKCSFTITSADLAASKKVINSCACPADGKNYVESLALRFVKL